MININNSGYLLNNLTNSYCKEKNSRVDDHIHASDLYNFCPRRYLLCKILGKSFHPDRQAGLGEKVTWDIGRKVQQFVAERLKNILVCEEMSIEYHILGHKIVGHVDLLIERGGNKPFMVEVKSIKPDDFDLLEAPLISHSMQLQSYLWLVKKADVLPCPIDTDSAVILYVCKLQKWEPFKVFDVELTKDFNKYMNKIVRILKAHSKEKEFLSEKICKTGNEFMARNCPERNLCFERK